MNDKEYVRHGEDFLAHHGMKGMHWGVRKEDKPGSTELTAKEHKILEKFDPDGSNSERLMAMYGPDEGLVQKKSRLSKGQKKALKIGAGIAVAGLLIYGLKKYGKVKQQRSIDAYQKDNPHLFAKGPLKNFWTKYSDVSVGRIAKGLSEDDVKKLGTEPYHFPAGSIVKRVVTRERHELNPDGFFAAYKDEDVERYKAIMPIFWKQVGFGDSTSEGFVASLRATSDVRAPSQVETLSIFKGMLDDKIETNYGFGGAFSETIRERLQTKHNQSHIDPENPFKRNEPLSDEALVRSQFPSATHKWADKEDNLTIAFFGKLKSLGYNAVSDLNDAGALADSPMRFLDGTVFEVAGHERLTRSNIEEAQNNLINVAHAMALYYSTLT